MNIKLVRIFSLKTLYSSQVKTFMLSHSFAHIKKAHFFL